MEETDDRQVNEMKPSHFKILISVSQEALMPGHSCPTFEFSIYSPILLNYHTFFFPLFSSTFNSLTLCYSALMFFFPCQCETEAIKGSFGLCTNTSVSAVLVAPPSFLSKLSLMFIGVSNFIFFPLLRVTIPATIIFPCAAFFHQSINNW